MRKTNEITVDTACEVVKDWSEACRWVELAISHEAERLISPESFLKAETLRAAWKRVQHG